jgi:branched-chain amino acid transport system ATP-binding protein
MRFAQAPTPPIGITPAMELDCLSAAYGPYRALFGVTIRVPVGGIVALLGSNGAGKSTVARVATGLLPASGGKIKVNGVDVSGRSAFQIARMGVAHVPEGRGVFASLTVEENLSLAFRERAGRKQVPELLTRAFDSFPVLRERRRQQAGTLSGGQQRLLSLVRVLIVPPAVLIADELCLGLAPSAIDSVYEGLQNINASGAAMIVVEQQVDRVLEIADRAVILEHGTVAYSGAPSGAIGAMEEILASRGERSTLVSQKGKSLR